MRVLVTGSNGQLGSELRELSERTDKIDWEFRNSESLDITDKNRVVQQIQSLKPDYVVNCAAYTAVDQAEDERPRAIEVNALAVGYLANACKETGATLIHFSTDYVFDGNGTSPYLPHEECRPIGVYGESKRLGEIEILSKEISALIIRTSWVYSSYGKNFVKTMMRLGAERDELNVVSDQIGAPTYAANLAHAVVDIISTSYTPDAPEIHHFSNSGSCSWYEFAREIMKLAELKCKVHPISTSQYPTKAKRPAYSLLSLDSFKTTFPDVDIPNWQEALGRCISRIKQTTN